MWEERRAGEEAEERPSERPGPGPGRRGRPEASPPSMLTFSRSSRSWSRWRCKIWARSSASSASCCSAWILRFTASSEPVVAAILAAAGSESDPVARTAARATREPRRQRQGCGSGCWREESSWGGVWTSAPLEGGAVTWPPLAQPERTRSAVLRESGVGLEGRVGTAGRLLASFVGRASVSKTSAEWQREGGSGCPTWTCREGLRTGWEFGE